VLKDPFQIGVEPLTGRDGTVYAGVEPLMAQSVDTFWWIALQDDGSFRPTGRFPALTNGIWGCDEQPYACDERHDE
jgi:hypothetical protein